MTLSEAWRAPPPMMLEVPEDCLMVMASSHTSSNQTLRIVQGPEGSQRGVERWREAGRGSTETVDAFGLFGADDGVLKGTAGLNMEDGVGRTTFTATTAVCEGSQPCVWGGEKGDELLRSKRFIPPS